MGATSMTTKALRLIAALAAVTALGSCGDDDGNSDEASTETTAPADPGDGAAGDGGDQVSIENFEFGPADLTVAAGTTVRWTNDDDAVHSVRGDGDLEYESDDLSQDDTFEQTFDDPGEQPYICGKHSYMKGTVTVE